MADLCFLCDKSDSEGEPLVEVARCIKTFRTASIERNDGHIDHLKFVISAKVHEKCLNVSFSINCIQAEKRRLEQGETTVPPSILVKSEVFDLKKPFDFLVVDEAAEIKKKEKYRRKVKTGSTLEFKDTVNKKAKERGDDFGELVKSRIFLQYNLIAAEAKYHAVCFPNF